MNRYRAFVLAIVLGGQTLLGSQAVYADFDSALEALRQQDFATALHEFRQLAEQGDAQGQFYLAGIYFTGLGGAEDVKTGVSWLKKSADLVSPQAQHSLGVMYTQGDLVELNTKLGLKWLNKAVKQGYTTFLYG